MQTFRGACYLIKRTIPSPPGVVSKMPFGKRSLAAQTRAGFAVIQRRSRSPSATARNAFGMPECVSLRKLWGLLVHSDIPAATACAPAPISSPQRPKRGMLKRPALTHSFRKHRSPSAKYFLSFCSLFREVGKGGGGEGGAEG